jgi:hypothetical protein
MSDKSNTVREILLPNDNCLKVPGEHCGSCIADFEDSTYSDMNCCTHQKWADQATQAIEQEITKSQVWILQELVLTTPKDKPLEPRINELIADLKSQIKGEV